MRQTAVWKILPAIAAVFAAHAMIAPAALAFSPSSGDLESRLEMMQREIEQLREENEAFRGEIDELRAATQDDWLTEQRAEEIRGIVYDVLADADMRASLVGDGLMAGWRDGFFLASADGRFKLGLSGHLQTRFIYNFRDQPDRHRAGFEVSRARLAFDGHLYTPDLQYMVRGDFRRSRRVAPPQDTQDRGSFHLLDAWVRYHFNNEWGVRFGQFKLPFSREFLVSSAHQQLVERSLVDANLNIGRSIGVELTYASGASRFMAAYSNGATDNLTGFNANVGGGAPQGQPTNISALSEAVEYAWTIRYEHLLAGSWRQFRDMTSPMGEEFGMMLGIAGHIQRDEATGFPTPPGRRHTRWYGYTIDASIEFGGANLFAAFTHHYVEAHQPIQPDNWNFFGLVAQGGMYITPKIETFLRYEFAHMSTELIDPSDLHLLTVGVNYYLEGHDVKWTTDIGFGISQVEAAWTLPNSITGYRGEGPDAKPQIVFRTQFQLLF